MNRRTVVGVGVFVLMMACLASCGSGASGGAGASTSDGAGGQTSDRLEQPPREVFMQANVWEFRTADADAARGVLGQLAASWRPAGAGTAGVIPSEQVTDVYRQIESLPGFARVKSACLADVTPVAQWTTLDGNVPDKARLTVPGHTIKVAGFANAAGSASGALADDALSVRAEWTLPDGKELRIGPTSMLAAQPGAGQNAVLLLAPPTADGVQRLTVLFASLHVEGSRQTATGPALSTAPAQVEDATGSAAAK